MNVPREYYSKLNKADRKENTECFHLYMQPKNQNKWTNMTKQKQSHRYREQAGLCQNAGDREGKK